jgi:hypothetical protein
LSVAVSGDGEMLSLLGMLPPANRPPNLLFGVVRFLGDPAAFHDYAVANWATIARGGVAGRPGPQPA